MVSLAKSSASAQPSASVMEAAVPALMMFPAMGIQPTRNWVRARPMMVVATVAMAGHAVRQLQAEDLSQGDGHDGLDGGDGNAVAAGDLGQTAADTGGRRAGGMDDGVALGLMGGRDAAHGYLAFRPLGLCGVDPFFVRSL